MSIDARASRGKKMISFLNGRKTFDVNGKTALITGAAQGIGLALARLLHERGAAVVIVDVNGKAADTAARTLGSRALGVTADVRDRSALERAVKKAVDRYGHLDVVIANAGVAPVPATIRVMDDNDFDRVIAINLTGVYNTVRPAMEQIIEHNGHVVVVSSAAAFSPGTGGCPYMISKAGVEQLGRALRLELAPHGATAQIAYFGIVETAMTRDMLDDDELGREMAGMLPWPLNRRITDEQAAQSVADGITSRAAASIAPAGWQQYSWLRGALNPIADSQLARNKGLHKLIRTLEARVRDPAKR